MSATNLRDLSTTMEARLPTRPSTPTTGRATPSRENLVTSMTRSESISLGHGLPQQLHGDVGVIPVTSEIIKNLYL